MDTSRLVLVLLGSVLRLFVRFHLLPRAELTDPGFGLQLAVVLSLSLGLYLILKSRHHQPVLRPLGWVWPRPAHILVAVIAGIVRGSGVALYLRFRNQSTPQIGLMELLLALLLGPILEESLFRGCLLPVLAQTTGSGIAVIVTSILFALFHQPANGAHWVSFTATGLAYGWIRVSSRSTAAAAVMHATYNLTVFLSAMC